MVPWIKWRGSGAGAEKQTQTFTPPPSCFTVGRRVFSPSMLVFDCDQIILFETSVQTMDFQEASASPKCSLGKWKQGSFVLFWEQRLPSTGMARLFKSQIAAFAFVHDATKKVYNSPEVMRWLPFIWFSIFVVFLVDSFDGRPLLGRVAVMLKALNL